MKNTTKREAERRARVEKERVKLELSSHTKSYEGASIRNMTFGHAVERYVNEVGSHAKAASEDEIHFDRLLEPDWVGEGIMITEIDDDLVAKVVAKRRAMYRHNKPHLGKLSNAYVNRTVSDLLQRVLTRARKVWKILLPNEPNWAQHRLAESERVEEMKIEQVARLETLAREDFWPAVQFAVLTGVRRMNVSSLTWDQVNWTERVIQVVTKGGRVREIIMTDEVEALLRAQLGKHPRAVFTTMATKTWTNPKSGERRVKGNFYPLTYDGYQSAWRSLCKAAGIKNLTIHDLRKTMGSRVARATGNIAAASKLLGHSSIAITAKHYAHITPEDLNDALARSSDLIKAKRAKLQTLSIPTHKKLAK